MSDLQIAIAFAACSKWAWFNGMAMLSPVCPECRGHTGEKSTADCHTCGTGFSKKTHFKAGRFGAVRLLPGVTYVPDLSDELTHASLPMVARKAQEKNGRQFIGLSAQDNATDDLKWEMHFRCRRTGVDYRFTGAREEDAILSALQDVA